MGSGRFLPSMVRFVLQVPSISTVVLFSNVLKFLVGLLSGIILTMLILVIGVFAIAATVGRTRDKSVNVSDGSTLVLRLDGDVPERTPVDYNVPFFGTKSPLTVENV